MVFDLIEAKCGGVNEQFNFKVYIIDFDNYEIGVLMMPKNLIKFRVLGRWVL